MSEIEARNEAMSKAQFDDGLKEKIIGTLIAEGAESLCDSEIDRCLGRCAAGWIPGTAKMYRDTGFLTMNDLNPEDMEVFIYSPFDCESKDGHVWDGKPITFRMGAATGGSTTCSKCGIAAIDFDMARCD